MPENNYNRIGDDLLQKAIALKAEMNLNSADRL